MKVTVEVPGITKQDIKVSAYESALEVSTTEKAERKYHRIIGLPPETDIETAKSTILMASWRQHLIRKPNQKKEKSK